MKRLIIFLLLVLFTFSLNSCDKLKVVEEAKLISFDEAPVKLLVEEEQFFNKGYVGYLLINPIMYSSIVEDLSLYKDNVEYFYVIDSKDFPYRPKEIRLFELYINDLGLKNKLIECISQMMWLVDYEEEKVLLTISGEYIYNFNDNKNIIEGAREYARKWNSKLETDSILFKILNILCSKDYSDGYDYYNFLNMVKICLENNKVLSISRIIHFDVFNEKDKPNYSNVTFSLGKSLVRIDAPKDTIQTYGIWFDETNYYLYGISNDSIILLNGGDLND